eukprot:4845834-Pyramimonas_sp.AAC.1
MTPRRGLADLVRVSQATAALGLRVDTHLNDAHFLTGGSANFFPCRCSRSSLQLRQGHEARGERWPGYVGRTAPSTRLSAP